MKRFNNVIKQKGFTLIELIVVIAIIGVLTALIVPSVMNYIEYANNQADVSNARRVYTILQECMADAVDNTISYSNPWGTSVEQLNHGYVYVDDNEIRTSSLDIAKLLANQSIIKKSALVNPNYRQGKEPQFSKDKINLTCKSHRNWRRYQINFVYTNSELVFTYSACRGTKSKDDEASKLFAEKAGGFPATSEISLGGLD